MKNHSTREKLFFLFSALSLASLYSVAFTDNWIAVYPACAFLFASLFSLGRPAEYTPPKPLSPAEIEALARARTRARSKRTR